MMKLMYWLTIPVVLLLSACGPNNPLIGVWDMEPQMGIKGTVEFTRGAVITHSNTFGTESSTEIEVSEYKVEKDKVGIVIEKDGQKGTIYYRLVDANTIALDAGFGAKVVYHRKK